VKEKYAHQFPTRLASYCASKAALNHLSEVLRLELIPFGVGVVTVLAGNVYTKFHDNDPLRLPAESRYAPIEEIIAGWASGASKPSGCTVDEFAEQLAGIVVSPKADGLVLKGPWAGTIDLLARWSPASVEVSVSLAAAGLASCWLILSRRRRSFLPRNRELASSPIFKRQSPKSLD
jgi:NAD(P)-dependent dehydrogenase (short-subunit alcohol dehydrogenase family)